jgi:vacuolar-type H+-ATPase catalytic subunit A/Vma1
MQVQSIQVKEKEMLKKLLMVVAMSAVAVSAIASDAARAQAEKVIELKDGSTVYIFQGAAKWPMEDKFGRAKRMDQDVVMETKDGQKIMMHGDEVSRLDSLLKQDTRGAGH